MLWFFIVSCFHIFLGYPRKNGNLMWARWKMACITCAGRLCASSCFPCTTSYLVSTEKRSIFERLDLLVMEYSPERCADTYHRHRDISKLNINSCFSRISIITMFLIRLRRFALHNHLPCHWLTASGKNLRPRPPLPVTSPRKASTLSVFKELAFAVSYTIERVTQI